MKSHYDSLTVRLLALLLCVVVTAGATAGDVQLRPGDVILLKRQGKDPKAKARWLQGNTLTGEVGLVASEDAQGTRWKVETPGSDGDCHLKCLDDRKGPFRYLDGDTVRNKVLLRKHTQDLTGTNWRILAAVGSTVHLKCLGNIEGPRWLTGHVAENRVDLRKLLDHAEEETDWQISVVENPIPVDACVLEFNLSENATVSIDGRDYGEEREITFRPVDAEKSQIKVQIRFASGEQKEVDVLLRGRQRIRLAMSDPKVPMPALVQQTGLNDTIASVAFAPDGRQILLGFANGMTLLWDPATGQNLRNYKFHRTPVAEVMFGTDGRTAVTHSLGTASHWEVASGQRIHLYPGGAVAAAISPDGRRMAIASPKSARLSLYDAETGNETLVLGSTDAVRLAFNPDNKSLLAGLKSGDLLLWDAVTGKELRRFRGDGKEVRSLAFSPDGSQILSGSDGGNAMLWETAAASPIRTLQGHSDRVFGVGFSSDGKQLLTASRDKTVIVWNAASGQKLRTIGQEDMTCAAFSADGRQVLTGAKRGTGTLWDTSTGQKIRKLESHTTVIESVRFSPDGRWLLISTADKITILWDLNTGRRLRTLAGAAGKGASLSPDGTHVLTKSENEAILWDVESGRKRKTFRGHTEPVRTAIFSPDGRQVLTGSADSTAIIWDLATGKRLRTLFALPKVIISSAAFNKDGQKVLIRTHDGAVLFDVATALPVRRFKCKDEVISQLDFSPRGPKIVAGTDSGTLIVWDSATGKELLRFKGHGDERHRGNVTSVAFSPDGRRFLSSAPDYMVWLWDGSTGAKLRNLGRENSTPTVIAFSPDGRLIATGSRDGVVRILDVTTGQLLLRLATMDGGADWIASTPQGFFDGSRGGREKVTFRLAGSLDLVPVDRFFKDFYRPGLLAEIYRGERPLPNVELGKSKPPVLKIVSPQDGGSVETDTVTVQVEATDQGGGVQGPWITNNGTAIQTPGKPVRQGNVVRRSFTLPLIEGENHLEVHAKNGDGSWESEPASIVLRCDHANAKPELYLLAVGIDRYTESTLNLKFAAGDAIAMAELFQQRGPALYGEGKVHVATLLDEQATKATILLRLQQLASHAKPQDVFLLMLCGHGVMIHQQYYFVPHDVKWTSSEPSEEDVRRQGLSREDLDRAVQEISALSRVMVYDTCQSGAMTGMGGSDSTFVKAMESSNREQGAYVIAASAALQSAREWTELGHGVLTYTLLAGAGAVREGPLTGRQVDKGEKDRVLNASDWATFAQRHVPVLTKERFGQKQLPSIHIFGEDFPLLPLNAGK